MAHTALGLLNTSVADCIVDLPRVTDKAVLQELLKLSQGRGQKTRAFYVKRRLKQLEKETRSIVNQWIPCTEEMPDSDQTVMTYAPDSVEPIWPAYHNGDQWMDLINTPIDDAKITHWMSFPEPPEVTG